MKEEYNYTLTVPLSDLDFAMQLLGEVRADHPRMRLARKPHRGGNARFYLSFPFAGMRTDLAFQKWFAEKNPGNWDLFGPNYGIWGLS